MLLPKLRYVPSAIAGLLHSIHEIPMLLCLGIGISLNQSVAFFEGLLGKKTAFVRTPKLGMAGAALKIPSSPLKMMYRARKKNLLPYFEIGMAVYALGTAAIAFNRGNYLSLPFLLMFVIGFAYVGVVSLFSQD